MQRVFTGAPSRQFFGDRMKFFIFIKLSTHELPLSVMIAIGKMVDRGVVAEADIGTFRLSAIRIS